MPSNPLSGYMKSFSKGLTTKYNNGKRINGRYTDEHRVKIEEILGRKLEPQNEIHHRDGDGKNNSNNNLIVCESGAYHKLLERREKAYRATGDAHKRHCFFCKEYDDLANLVEDHPIRNLDSWYHSECRNVKQRQYRLNKARKLEN